MGETALDPSREGLIERLARAGFDTRFLPDGTPCAETEQGACRHRVFVASVPKAGTYLAHAALTALGVRPTNLHVFQAFVSDYRRYVPGSYRGAYKLDVPMADSLRLVLPGQFAVGHLHPEPAARVALDGFRVVFVQREMRRALVSWARYVAATEPDWEVTHAALAHPDGQDRVRVVLTASVTRDWYLWTAREMLSWLSTPGAIPVRFEELAGEFGPLAQSEVAGRLVTALDLPTGQAETLAAVRQSIGVETITYSGSRSDLATHWDDRLESWFRSVGGPDLNRELGYADAPHGHRQEAA